MHDAGVLVALGTDSGAAQGFSEHLVAGTHGASSTHPIAGHYRGHRKCVKGFKNK